MPFAIRPYDRIRISGNFDGDARCRLRNSALFTFGAELAKLASTVYDKHQTFFTFFFKKKILKKIYI